MSLSPVDEFFGFNRTPFSIAPDPELMYWSEDHREALTSLEYGIHQGTGLVLFSGEVGTGKTTTVRRLLSKSQAEVDYALILNPFLEGDELLFEICSEFGLEVKEDNSDVSLNTRCFNALRAFLIENHSNDKQSVVIIDEAQHLSFKAMEQLRLLSNLETDEKKLLLVVFVGQPELRQLIQKPELRQLAQRITFRPHLRTLTKDDTRNYIYCRLELVGISKPSTLVSSAVSTKVYELTQGVPRSINSLLERALLVAFSEQAAELSVAHIIKANGEVNDWQVDEHKRRINPVVGSAVGVTLAALLALSWTVFNTFNAFNHPSAQHAIQSLNRTLASEYSVADDCLTRYSTSHCDDVELTRLEQALHLRKPVLIEGRFGRYAVLKQSQFGAVLLDDSNRWNPVQLDDLPAIKAAHIIWSTQENVPLPLQLGDSHPVVAYVAQQLAKTDHQEFPLTTGVYNSALRDRVKLYQRNIGQDATGRIDNQTWLQMALDGVIELNPKNIQGVNQQVVNQ